MPTGSMSTVLTVAAVSLSLVPLTAAVPVDQTTRMLQADRDAFLKAAPAATKGACLDEFPDSFRQACTSQFEPKLPSLERMIQTCSWSSLPIPTVMYAEWDGWGGQQTGYKQDQHFVKRDRWGMERCVEANPAPADMEPGNPTAMGRWELTRMGPFNTTGGSDWTSLNSASQNMLNAIAEQCRTTGTAPPGLISTVSPDEDASLQPNCTTVLAGDPSELFVPFFGSQYDYNGGRQVFAVREYFLGAIASDGSVLGYPPLHMHHFHMEEAVNPSGPDSFPGGLVTHGDDQCLESAGGVNCNARLMPDGMATLMELPIFVALDINDVRANGSAPLTWYMLSAVRGLPHDGTFKSLSQIKMIIEPFDCDTVPGTPGYLVPAGELTAYWREGQFTTSGSLTWAYWHTHPLWAAEYILYVGASAAAMGLDMLPVGNRARGYMRATVEAARESLAQRAQRAGAYEVCHYMRDERKLEMIPHTDAAGDEYWRKSHACWPFDLTVGLPFVAFVVVSPSSDAAAHTHVEYSRQDEDLGNVHTFLRLFLHVPETERPVCTGDQNSPTHPPETPNADNVTCFSIAPPPPL